ncbi:MAG: hypothetical protein QGG89_03350 [Vicinamibacterales bacterium]|nr:hypothetical protein [Vicinamibacterales bacterium]
MQRWLPCGHSPQIRVGVVHALAGEPLGGDLCDVHFRVEVEQPQ